MQRAIDIMKLPVNPRNEKLISIQASIAGTVFSTTARTDPSKMKAQATDRIGEILDQIRGEQAEAAE